MAPSSARNNDFDSGHADRRGGWQEWDRSNPELRQRGHGYVSSKDDAWMGPDHGNLGSEKGRSGRCSGHGNFTRRFADYWENKDDRLASPQDGNSNQEPREYVKDQGRPKSRGGTRIGLLERASNIVHNNVRPGSLQGRRGNHNAARSEFNEYGSEIDDKGLVRRRDFGRGRNTRQRSSGRMGTGPGTMMA